MADQAKPFVRPYDPADDPAVDRIFRETCDAMLKKEPAWTIGSYIWAHPYARLSPETCFVLDPGTGQPPVGYIFGTPSTSAFANTWATTYIPSLDPEEFPPPLPNSPAPPWSEDLPGGLLHAMYHPENLLHPAHPKLVEDYPGHLHIDILPEYQRGGYGRALMEHFLGEVGKRGCWGVHLGMAASNVGAEKFYGRMGFERWQEVMDGGKSGEMGWAAGTLWLVKKVEASEKVGEAI